MRGDVPSYAFFLQDIVTVVDSLSTILTLFGGIGKVAGSGVLWKMMFGFLGSSTEIDADQDVSPLSEEAVQVYKPVSSAFKFSIFNDPVPLIEILGSYWSSEMGSTFFIQVIVGEGSPLASQGRMASVLIGKVWLAGPT